MQPDIYNDPALRDLTEKFSAMLEQMRGHDLQRQALAAMAHAMQQEPARTNDKDRPAHAGSLELIMRGVYTTLTGDGGRSPHPEQKITGGYICLMADLQEDRRSEICTAFDEFQKVLYAK